MNCFHISIIYNMINIPELIRTGFIEAFCLIPLLQMLADITGTGQYCRQSDFTNSC